MKLFLLIFVLSITGCAQLLEEKASIKEGKIWDFDHDIQFEQYKRNDKLYNLTIRSTSKTRFEALTAFLVRQSFYLCKNYGFKIEVVKGVETYNEEKYIKTYIPESLEANIECAPN